MSQNKLANPDNGIELGQDVNCGCDGTAATCQANFSYVYDGANTLTVTDASFLAAGAAIVTPNGVTITVQDQAGTTPVVDNTGDGTAPVAVNITTLDKTTTLRVDYNIVTDDNCDSTITLFFTPSNASEATGSSDIYEDKR